MPAGLRRAQFPLIASLAACACLIASLGTACEHQQAPTLPPAELYPNPAVFSGEWIGEVGGLIGALSVSALGHGRYRGGYQSDDGAVEYVLLLEQTVLPDADGVDRPSNRVTFTWQDGRGGRGSGWLLVNREDSALTGESTYSGTIGGLPWQFIRVE